MRVLDAFHPQGATWLGQVISSPPGPSGGPFMAHILPGGGVPGVDSAGGPVPPRLPHFATPRSVHRLAAVAAGAYPPRRPPDVWSPGAPARPGPCYWLVASGTPLGWRGGCLALGLVRGAVRHYCLGGCSALVVCARRSRLVRGGRAGAWCRVLPVSRFQPRVSRAVCGGPSRPGVPCPCSLVRHSMRSVPSAGSVRLPLCTGRMKHGCLQEGCLNATLELTVCTCYLMQGLTYARTNDWTHIPKQYRPAKIVYRSHQVRMPSRTDCAAVQVFNLFRILQLCFCSILASCHLQCQKSLKMSPHVAECATPRALSLL